MGALAPDVYAVHDPSGPVSQDHAARDRVGRVLPPCIVMPRAESLEEWSQRAAADVFQAASVRSDCPLTHYFVDSLGACSRNKGSPVQCASKQPQSACCSKVHLHYLPLLQLECCCRPSEPTCRACPWTTSSARVCRYFRSCPHVCAPFTPRITSTATSSRRTSSTSGRRTAGCSPTLTTPPPSER